LQVEEFAVVAFLDVAKTASGCGRSSAAGRTSLGNLSARISIMSAFAGAAVDPLLEPPLDDDPVVDDLLVVDDSVWMPPKKMTTRLADLPLPTRPDQFAKVTLCSAAVLTNSFDLILISCGVSLKFLIRGTAL
jgi:hypothetical protein